MMANNHIINEMEKPIISEKIPFTQEKETTLMTLYTRAVQSQRQNPILPDKWAEDGGSLIGYDFSKFGGGKIGAMITAIRAKKFNLLATQYLAASNLTLNTWPVRPGRMA